MVVVRPTQFEYPVSVIRESQPRRVARVAAGGVVKPLLRTVRPLPRFDCVIVYGASNLTVRRSNLLAAAPQCTWALLVEHDTGRAISSRGRGSGGRCPQPGCSVGRFQAVRFGGFWAPMDNLKERMALEETHRSGNRPWRREARTWRIMPVVEQPEVPCDWAEPNLSSSWLRSVELALRR
jgi:hypothetical protein